MTYNPGQIFGSSTPRLFPSYLSDLSQIPIYTKSRIFVSYHHRLDQEYYDTFSRCICYEYEVLYDNSPERAKDSNDIPYIMRSLREKHIHGTSCTIVLCGAETRWRKFVDWEIDATLSKDHGLIGVLLPTVPTYLYPNGPHLPARLQDNIDSGYALFTTWHEIVQKGPYFVREMVALAKGKTKSLIRNDRPMMFRNEPPPWQ